MKISDDDILKIFIIDVLNYIEDALNSGSFSDVITWIEQRKLHLLPPDKQFIKVTEELGELSQAYQEYQDNPQGLHHLKEEVGDVFISVATLCSQLEIRPDECIRISLQKNRMKTYE